MRIYEFVHTSLGLCFWEIPALLTGLGMIIAAVVHNHNQKKRNKDFEEGLEEKIKELTGEKPVEA